MSLGEIHASTGPISTESAGLDAGELDVPFWLDLMADGLGEALDCPFAGAVEGEL
jgi:hypothetical protein